MPRAGRRPDGAPLGPATGNREPDPREFAASPPRSASATRATSRACPKVEWFSLWNEPNHHFFLKPNEDAPRIYRRDGRRGAAGPARCGGRATRRCWSGETAPIRRPGSVLGPRDFLRRWLCLDDGFQPTPDEPGCRGFRGFDVDGYAHHPYGPTSKTPEHADIVSLLVIRRLGRYLDRAAAAGRLPRGPADLQHRVRAPVEPSRSDGEARPRRAGRAPEREGGAVVSLPARAQLRAVPALRRPAAPGRHAEGDLVRLPDRPAVHRRDGRSPPTTPTGCRSWCSARAAAACSSGAACARGAACAGRSCMRGGRRGAARGDERRRLLRGDRSAGRASYRFRAFDADGKRLGTSRTARPVAATPSPD